MRVEGRISFRGRDIVMIADWQERAHLKRCAQMLTKRTGPKAKQTMAHNLQSALGVVGFESLRELQTFALAALECLDRKQNVEASGLKVGDRVRDGATVPRVGTLTKITELFHLSVRFDSGRTQGGMSPSGLTKV